MTEPTDKELLDLGHECELDAVAFGSAVLAKWGTPPAVAGEHVGWMWQHDETGRTGFVDCWQVENGWQEGNPRLRLISKLYATPQPTQAQEPLTDAQIAEMMRDTWGCASIAPRHALEFARAVERAHGITGGQHGASH